VAGHCWQCLSRAWGAWRGPVATCARKTHRLTAVLRAIGIALGGKAGARFAARLGRPPVHPGSGISLLDTGVV